MTQTFVFSRLESITKRFSEVDLLLSFAVTHKSDTENYTTFCRTAHIILIAHFEGIIKDICRDIIDDINRNNKFETVPKKIFETYCKHFLLKDKKEYTKEEIYGLRLKLEEALGNSVANLKVTPFLYSDNKNLAPSVMETIIERFGVARFFWSLKNSDLEVVFSDSKTDTENLRNLLKAHISEKTIEYPYTVSSSIYNPTTSHLTQKKEKTLWEEFIDDILKERHGIVHGQSLSNPYNHEELNRAKNKIEILVYVFIINICSVANPSFPITA